MKWLRPERAVEVEDDGQSGKAESNAKQMQQKIKYIEIIFRDIFLRLALRLWSSASATAQVMWPTHPAIFAPLSMLPAAAAALASQLQWLLIKIDGILNYLILSLRKLAKCPQNGQQFSSV